MSLIHTLASAASCVAVDQLGAAFLLALGACAILRQPRWPDSNLGEEQRLPLFNLRREEGLAGGPDWTLGPFSPGLSGTEHTTTSTREVATQMISLTYMSNARVPFTDEDLVELLALSRERNHAAGLTGQLLYAGGHFIQTLEGPAEAVDATFARIERDQRHRSILITLREDVDERVFPDWSMGFESLEPGQADRLPGFSSYLAHGTVSEDERRRLGRAGIFHRVFRDNMR